MFPVELAGVRRRFRFGRVAVVVAVLVEVLVEVEMYKPPPQHLPPNLIPQLSRKLQERRDGRISLDTTATLKSAPSPTRE